MWQGVIIPLQRSLWRGKNGETMHEREPDKWIVLFKWNDACVINFNFFIGPSRKLRASTTEFEYDKNPGEVCAVSPNNRLFMLLQTANCKTCYDEVTCTILHSRRYARNPRRAAPLSCLAAEIGSRTRVFATVFSFGTAAIVVGPR